jgi:nucleoside phosphorylase
MAEDPSQPIRRVAISIAMAGEARGLIDGLSMRAEGPLVAGLSPEWYSCSMDNPANLEVAVVVAGTDPEHGVDRIGTEAAVLGVVGLHAKWKPDLLLNTGTCGGFQARGGTIGTLYLASEAFLFHGRRIPLPGFEALGEGRIPAMEAEAARLVFGAERGIVSTSNSFTASPEDLAFFERERVAAKDMEAAAIARVARDLGAPFLSLKGVTDLIDHPEPEEAAFLRNYKGVVDRLTASMVRFIEWLGEGRSLGELAGKEKLPKIG